MSPTRSVATPWDAVSVDRLKAPPEVGFTFWGRIPLHALRVGSGDAPRGAVSRQWG